MNISVPISLVGMSISLGDILSKIFSASGDKDGLSPKDLEFTFTPMNRCKGLIAFVSMGRGWTSARDAISFHAHGPDGKSRLLLEHVWLVYSPASCENSENLRQHAEKLSVNCHMHKLDISNSIYDLQTIKGELDKIAGKAPKEGLDFEDIAIDITGGTAIASIAFFLAGLIYRFKIEYMKPNETDINGQAKIEAGSTPFEIEVRTGK
ncbi:MAG: hypothetical protein GXO58_01660 [Thermodesulfobacteria bacterium]|nr:hypothetical protein [Thermodesulfobacteriota bacterium]